jgi:hypothetical protein
MVLLFRKNYRVYNIYTNNYKEYLTYHLLILIFFLHSAFFS